MKKVRDAILAILILVAVAMAVSWMYRNGQNKIHKDLAKRMAELSPRGGPPETIEGLKTAIALYEQQIELNVKEGAQTGVYWKILGIRLADKKMHHDALDAFERAVYYNAEDPTLFFLTGESASVVAASALSLPEKERFQKLAETAYLRAIQLDETYGKPRFGIGMLYAFDMNKPAEAIPHLETFLKAAPNDIRGMFVLARAYYMTEAYDNAVELYDRIISRTKDPKVRAEAQNNKDIIWNSIYG